MKRRTHLHNNRVDPLCMLDYSVIFSGSSSVRITLAGKDGTWRNSLGIPGLLSIHDAPSDKIRHGLLNLWQQTSLAVASVIDLLHDLQKLLLEACF